MPHLPILEHELAPVATQTVYDEFYQRMSFPAAPNFIKTQGHSSSVARGTWELVKNVLVTGDIPRWMKEMIFVAISKDRQCLYCAAAHIACCRMLGVDQKLMAQLVSDLENIYDVKLRAMIQFALKCSRNPQSLSDEDYSKLFELGLKKSEAMELVAMSALAVYANILADATAMDPDKMFDEI